ncbi:MAG: hypothetical protein EYC69_04045 [Bacteroidetes bacterium]|nr:MAG: hypothetical protein EYC69_04045 [Bacteroidota bacterium]
MIRFLLIVMLLFVCGQSQAQTVAKLTITDNLAASSKFGYGKPKPAPAKDQFEMIEDKGTQVLFYADVTPSETLPDAYRLLFTAYKLSSGKNEWVDERMLDLKKTSTYALTAVNFFDSGDYKIVITSGDNKDVVLAEGNFSIYKN